MGSAGYPQGHPSREVASRRIFGLWRSLAQHWKGLTSCVGRVLFSRQIVPSTLFNVCRGSRSSIIFHIVCEYHTAKGIHVVVCQDKSRGFRKRSKDCSIHSFTFVGIITTSSLSSFHCCADCTPTLQNNNQRLAAICYPLSRSFCSLIVR